MNNKLIIFSTIFFLLISFVFLSSAERKTADINNQNIWMIYFENPQNQTLDFKIENHASISSFHWQVSINKNAVKQGNATVNLGETRKIPVSLSGGDFANKKITVTVTSDNKTKEIYKNF